MPPDTPGVVVRALTAGRAVRLLIVEAAGPAERTRRVHGLGTDAARLGAEALVAAALASGHLDDEEQLTLQIQGERPACAVYADVTGLGDLRVRVSPPDLHLGPGEPIEGLLLAIKHVADREMYRGITAIGGTTLERALAEHLGTSAQVDAVLRLGAWGDEDGRVRGAGGLVLERLPPEPDQPSLTPEAFAERFGWVATADLRELLVGLAFGRVGEDAVEVVERRPLTWKCRCSVEKIEDTLAALPRAELRAMVDEDHGAEVRCHFCSTVYTITEQRLRDLLPS